MDDNKKKLYDALSEEYDLGSFDDFTKDMEDDNNRKDLFDAIKDDYEVGETYDDFYNTFFPAPKAEKQSVSGGLADNSVPEEAVNEAVPEQKPARKSVSADRKAYASMSPQERRKAFNEQFRQKQMAKAEADPEGWEIEKQSIEEQDELGRQDAKLALEAKKEQEKAVADEPAPAVENEGYSAEEAEAAGREFAEIAPELDQMEARINDFNQRYGPLEEKIKQFNEGKTALSPEEIRQMQAEYPQYEKEAKGLAVFAEKYDSVLKSAPGQEYVAISDRMKEIANGEKTPDAIWEYAQEFSKLQRNPLYRAQLGENAPSEDEIQSDLLQAQVAYLENKLEKLRDKASGPNSAMLAGSAGKNESRRKQERELKKAISDAKEALYANPYYRKYIDKKEAYNKARSEEIAVRRDERIAQLREGYGQNVPPGFFHQQEMADPEIQRLDAASRMHEDAIREYETPTKYDETNGWVNAAKGLGDWATDSDTWTFGLQQFVDDIAVVRPVLDKVEEIAGKVSQDDIITNGKLDELEKQLTPGELAVLDAYFEKVGAVALKGADTSIGYQIGQGIGDMVNLGVEMALTGPVGGAVRKGIDKAGLTTMKKLMEKRLYRNFAKSGFGRVALWSGHKVGRDVLETAVRLPFMPSTYKAIGEGAVTLNSEYKTRDFMDYAPKETFKQFVEQLTEVSNGFAFPLIGKVVKTPGMTKFINGMLGEDGARVLKSFMERGDIKLLDDAMIGSFGGEWEEELLGAFIHSVTDDPNALRDFFSAEQQLVLLGTLAPIPLTRGTVGGVQLAVPAAKAGVAWSRAERELKRLGFDEGRIARLKEVVDNSTAPEGARAIMQTLKDAGFSRRTREGQGFVSAVETPENDILYGSVPAMDRDAYDALAHYYWAAQQKRAVGLMGEVEQDRKVRDKRADMKSKYGQFWHNEMGEEGEEVVETGMIIGADGNPLNVFIASDEPMEDGRVAYVGEDGSNGFLSRDQLVGQNADGTFAPNPETTVTPINIYLAGLVMRDSQVQEAQGVVNEASAANTSLRDQIEGLADVKYKGQSGTITRADDEGAVFVPDEGENVRVTWSELAAENGIQEPEVKTPAERTGDAAALVAEHTRLKQELAGAFRQASDEAGKNGRGALLETDEGTATVVNIISDTIDPENGTAQFTVRMPDGSMNVTMATAIEPVMSQFRGESAPEPEPEPAPAPAPAPGPQPPAGGAGGAELDFRGNPIPTRDGEIDEEAFRESDPEAWAAWNDALPEGDPRKATLGTKKRLEGLAKSSKSAADKAQKDLEKLYDKGATDKEIREKEAEVRDQRARQKRYEDAIASMDKRELDKAEAEREAARKAAEAERLRREKEKEEEEKRKAGKAPDISEDTPEAAQKRGYIMVNGNRIDRPTPDAVAEKGKDTKIAFTKSVAVDGKYGLVEATRIEPSHVSDQENPLHFFAKKWQPKNRKRADSAVAIQQMANGIRPGEITRGETAYGGAPIVNERGEVIQGNGRSEALRRAYGQGTAAEYKAWLAEHAEEFGLTREQVEKMETPILVRVLDVDDARAEQLGKMEQKDLESGGDQRFNGKTLVKKMGRRFGEFLDYLFAGDLGDDATALDYINQNGYTALHWLHQNGFINDTEYANAQENGKLTEETVSAFRAMSIEPLFDNVPEKVRSGFEMLPNSVKLALQRSVATLYGLEGVIGDIQDALDYYCDFETADPAFKKAKNTEEAWNAVAAWMQNVRFDGTSEGEAHPSIVARRFASVFKGGVLVEGEKNPKRTEKAFRSLFTNIASTMRGEGGFMSAAEPTDNIGAYRENNVITREEENQIRNGKNDNRPGPASGAGANGQVGGQGSGAVREGRPGGVPERKPAGEGAGPVAPKTPANPAPETPSGFGANNKLFTKDARDKAREIMLRKLKGQLNAGIDPEMLTAMIQYCGYYIEAGVRTFVEFAKTAIADLGDAIRPYLKSMYTAVRHYPDMEEYAKEMTPYDEVEKVDVDTIGKEEEPVEEPVEEPAAEPAPSQEAKTETRIEKFARENFTKIDKLPFEEQAEAFLIFRSIFKSKKGTEGRTRQIEDGFLEDSAMEYNVSDRYARFMIDHGGTVTFIDGNYLYSLAYDNGNISVQRYYEGKIEIPSPAETEDALGKNETQEIRDAVDAIVSGKDKRKRTINDSMPVDYKIAGKDVNSYIRDRYDKFKAPLEKRREELRKELVAYRDRIEEQAKKDILARNPHIKEDNPHLPDYVSEEADKRLKNDTKFNELDSQIKAIDNEIGNYQERRYNAVAAVSEIYAKTEVKPEEIKENPSESPEKSVTLEGEEEVREKFTDTVANRLIASIASGERPFKSITDLRKAAREAGMEVDEKGATDILLQELAEVAIVRAARKFMSQFNGGLNSRNAFNAICKLYEMQPTISMRSSQRVAMQQYSTPLPMSFVAQMFAYKAGMKDVLEPTAGNGMLVFGIPSDKVHANELDDTRKANLDAQGFKEVTQNDATEPFSGKYDAVVANPPFGSHDAVSFDGKSISGLDPVITLRALDAMKDDGKAAIIIGGNIEWADNGSWKSKKAFFAYLYDHYNVKGVVNMAGDMYARQGTSYPTTMILIDGRRSEEERAKSQVFPPVREKARKTATTNDELFDIVTEILNDNRKTDGNEVVRTEGERKPADRIGQTGSLFAGDDSAEPAENGTDGRGNDGGTVVQGPGRDAVSGKDEPSASAGSRSSGERPGNERDVPAAKPGELAERPADSGGEGVSGPVSGGRAGTDGVGSEVAGVGDAGRERPEPVPSGEPAVRKPVRLARKVEDRNLAYVQHSSGRSLESVAPAAMVEAMDAAIQKIEKEQGRTIDEFVTEELGYESTAALHKALAAEQIDSVAMAIYQMKKGKAMIIGDQTGVGKGRQMAALIRWANRQGKTPIFMTQKAGLFSDIYRDLRDIGSGNLKPLILNSAEMETDKETGEKHWKDTAGVMLDEEGNLKYQSPGKAALDKIIESGKVPDGYDFVVLTYSQLNNGDQQSRTESKKKIKDGANPKGFAKAAFVRQVVNDNYIILDESHTAAGEGSNSGAFLRSVMPSVKGVTFSSATFAKRPDTMPLYAIKSAMSEANVEPNKLIAMIKKGGVTLQEIMARALTRSGQMVRRERDMSDVKTDWKTVDDPATAKKARANYDRAIEIFNKIIQFQRNFITPVIDDISRDLAEMASSASETSGTKNFGVDNPPFVSQTYNFTKQLMLALKAEAIVDEVIKEIKAGRHPVIALENTYESGLDAYAVGDKIEDTSFSAGLLRSLGRILQYTVTDPDGKKSQEFLTPEELGPEAAKQYYALQDEIREATKGIFLSPLDLIKEKLTGMGYNVGEVTGRKTHVVKEDDGYYRRERVADAKQAVRDFNSGASDVIIINKSGSTGISLHSSVAFKDQRPRSMIIAQPLGDINDYMQMIGRIDRTGQVHRGYYINLSLPVPAELRFNMMLASKLKSLNANTTTSQESETSSVEAPDFLNKYGSQVVIEYLRDNPDVFSKLVETGMKLGGKQNAVTTSAELENYRAMDEDIQKVTGRIALLPVEEQEKFYADISERYNTLIKYLDETGENTLKITTLPLKSKTLARRVGTEGKDPGGNNPFAQNSYVERVEVDVLRKPMKADEIRKVRETLTGGKEFGEYRDGLVSRVNEQEKTRLASEEERYNREKEKTQKEIDKQIAALEAKVKNMDEVTRKAEANRITNRLMANLEEKHQANVASIKSMHRKLREKFEQFNTDDTYLVYEELEGGNLLEEGNAYSPALFCGFKTAKAGENLTPSTSVAVFATLDGRRRLEIKFTSSDILDEISNFTNQNYYVARDTTIDNWDSSISNASREERYILTGNILQAWDDATKEGILPGRLVSYTDIDGNIHDGILMNQSWQPTQLRSSGAPINSRTEQILNGEAVRSTDGEVEIEHEWGDMFSIYVPKTKKAGAKYFENEDILSLIFRRQGFHQYRGRFTATVTRDNMRALLNILGDLGVRVNTEENESAWEELNRSAENLSNPIDRAAAITKINEIAKKLGVKFEEDSSLKAKGAFNPKTGKIRINIDAHRDSADLEATLLHEAVAHYGLRKLFGKDWKELRMRLYEQASPEIKARVDAIAKADGLSTEVAMEEYIAQLAEDGRFDEQEESFWQKVVTALKRLLAKIGINSGYLTDEDFRAMLYASYRNLQTRGAVAQAHHVSVMNALRKAAELSHEEEDNGPDDGGPSGGLPSGESDENTLNEDEEGGLNDLPEEVRQLAIEQDTDELYRRSSQGATAQTAAEMYGNNVRTIGSAVHEVLVDEYHPIDILMDALASESKSKIKDDERVSDMMRETGGKAMQEIREYDKKFLQPMWTAVGEFRKNTGSSIKDTETYIGLKSGLERNVVLAKRDAKRDYQAEYDAEIDKINQEEKEKKKVLDRQLKNGKISDVTYAGELTVLQQEMKQKRDDAETERQARFADVDAGTDKRYLEYRKKDYSAITAWAEKEDLQEAEQLASDYVADMESRAGASTVKEMWKRINAATKETLKFQYEHQILSRQQYQDISRMMDYYVPMRGFSEDTAEDLFNYYVTAQSNDFQATVLTAKGRKTWYEGPLGNIGAMHSSAIAQGVKNTAKLSLLDAVRRRPENTIATVTRAWFVKNGQKDVNGKDLYDVAYPQIPEGATRAQREAIVEQFEQDMKEAKERGDAYNSHREVDLHGGVVAFEKESHKNEHVVKVREGGKEYGIIINGNPAAAQALNGVRRGNGTGEKFLGIMRSWTRLLSSMFTTFSVPFWVSNFQRDHGQGLTNAFIRNNREYVGRYIKNRMRAIKLFPYIIGEESLDKAIAKGDPVAKLYKQYLDNGGPMGQNRIEDNEYFERKMKRFLDNSAKQGIVKGGQAILNFIGGVGETIETITRFAVFMTSMEAGRPIHESVSDAKEISTNFARKGSGRSFSRDELDRMTHADGTKLNAVEKGFVNALSIGVEICRATIPFFNAAVQGLENKVTNYREHWGKTLAADSIYLMLGLGMKLLFGSAGGDDDKEKYSHTSDYLRRNNILSPLGNGVYAKWALPQEYRVMYALGDIIGSAFQQERPIEDLGADAFGALMQLSPIGAVTDEVAFSPENKKKAYETLITNASPGIIAPVLESIFNMDFKGARIYNEGFNENLRAYPGWTKALPTTGKEYVAAAKWLNEISGGNEVERGWININPAVVEHLVESYFSGPYQIVVRAPEAAVKVAKGEATVRDVPLLNRIILNTNDNQRDALYSNMYYYFKELNTEAARIHSEYKGRPKEGKAADFYKSKEYQYMLVFKKYDSMERNLRKASKVMDEKGDKEAKEGYDKRLDDIHYKIAKECLDIYFNRNGKEEVK